MTAFGPAHVLEVVEEFLLFHKDTVGGGGKPTSQGLTAHIQVPMIGYQCLGHWCWKVGSTSGAGQQGALFFQDADEAACL